MVMLSLPYVEDVKHTYIKISTAKLHIAEAGKGKPLLLLHGWPQHWYVWRKIVPELSKKYHLIMPDLPGFGWSGMPHDNDFRKEALAENIIELIEALKLKHIGLIGHDWGGWIGFLMCLRRPDLFSNYLSLAITSPIMDIINLHSQRWRFSYQLAIATPLIGETLLRFSPAITKWGMKQCAYKKDVWTKDDLQIFSSVLQNTEKAHASSLLYRTFLTRELPLLKRYKSQKLQVNSRLVIGENDPIINPALFRRIKQINNLSISYIKNCGHFIPEEQPEKVITEAQNLFS
jgi:pimeloyl-ACP methyl ester carboxylesterase